MALSSDTLVKVREIRLRSLAQERRHIIATRGLGKLANAVDVLLPVVSSLIWIPATLVLLKSFMWARDNWEVSNIVIGGLLTAITIWRLTSTADERVRIHDTGKAFCQNLASQAEALERNRSAVDSEAEQFIRFAEQPMPHDKLVEDLPATQKQEAYRYALTRMGEPCRGCKWPLKPIAKGAKKCPHCGNATLP
jgi:hypothetical protein